MIALKAAWLITLLLLMLKEVDSYSDRIPVEEQPEICESMDPTGHNTTAQDDESPYLIVYNTNQCYSDHNNKIYVTIYHKMAGGFFEGVFLQARVVGGSKQSLGVFDNNGDTMFKPYSCGNAVNNTFGHRGHDHFHKTVLGWTPPEGLESNVQFVATMVRKTTRYWLNVRSSVLHHDATCRGFAVTDPPLLPTTTSEAPARHASSCLIFLISFPTLINHWSSSLIV